MNLKKFFNQKAVYWPTPTPDGYGGYTYGEPVEVDVRWTVKQEKFLSSQGAGNGVEEILSRVVVLSEIDFDMKGRMALMNLIDLSSSSTPEIEGALTIEGFEKIPTIKADQFLRKAFLV